MRNALILSAVLLLAAPAFAADQPPPTPPPSQIPHGSKDYTTAPAGDYNLDKNHVGVIARVSHLGFSISIFRFGDVDGKLTWDPAAPEKSALSVTVKTASIETNVPKFAEELAGPKYLNAPAFPDATFVSTRFVKTDATHGKVTGNFTLKGKTKPVTFDVTLIGAGAFFGGHNIGIHAEGMIDPQDYDMGPFFKEPIQLVIDTEFSHKG